MNRVSLLLCLIVLLPCACTHRGGHAPQSLAGHTLHLTVPVTLQAGSAKDQTQNIQVSYRFKNGNVSEKSAGRKVLTYTRKDKKLAEATLSGDVPVLYTLTFKNAKEGTLNIHRTAANGKETDSTGSFKVE